MKLVNFCAAKVAGRLIRSPFAGLLLLLKGVLGDVGAFLDVRLYEELLVHFYGGEEVCVQRVAVSRDGIALGTQRFPCHADGLAFLVSALPDAPAAHAYEAHLRKLIRFTKLRGIQWLNLAHADVQAVTIGRDA